MGICDTNKSTPHAFDMIDKQSALMPMPRLLANCLDVISKDVAMEILSCGISM